MADTLRALSWIRILYWLTGFDKLDPAAAAPLLCAGITTYLPLRKWKVGKGQKVPE